MAGDEIVKAGMNDAQFERIRGTTAGWIAAADAKANSILTLCGTLLALAALAFAVATPRPSLTARVGLVIFVLFDVAAAFCALFSLWPRTDRLGILRDAGRADAKGQSLSFFADLAGLPFSGFVDLVQKATDADFATDTREQALVLCRIATRKMHASRAAVGCVAAALLALAFAVAWAALEN